MLGWAGLDWTGLGWAGLAELGWVRLGWAGLGFLGRTGLDFGIVGCPGVKQAKAVSVFGPLGGNLENRTVLKYTRRWGPHWGGKKTCHQFRHQKQGLNDAKARFWVPKHSKIRFYT